MEPTDFEKWCAGELMRSVKYIILFMAHIGGELVYSHNEIEKLHSAYMAGVRSRLPYQTPPKGDEDGMD
ncbi:TPA: hypothetical protein RG728_003854 [Morganella morganii subsp. morganii]|nr:hypothetical protein [Morganella morganii subsp. morganii]